MSAISRTSIGNGPAGAAGEDAAERQQIALAAREFEALFLQQMLQQMRRSMLSEDVKEQGLGADTMTDTMDADLARHLAGQPGGLYDVLVQAFAGQAPPPSRPGAAAAAAGLAGLSPVAATGSIARAGSAEPALDLPAGKVSSAFGWRTDPITGGQRFHNGVDIAAAYGTDVASAGTGRVVFAGEQGGYGQTIVIEHGDGRRTRYAHLSHVGVAAGEPVERGAIIGRVGNSGRSTGAHLHFEVLEAGQPVDPKGVNRPAAGLKVRTAVADYPRGTARTVVSPEE